mgnify:CR=1 FL=1
MLINLSWEKLALISWLLEVDRLEWCLICLNFYLCSLKIIILLKLSMKAISYLQSKLDSTSPITQVSTTLYSYPYLFTLFHSILHTFHSILARNHTALRLKKCTYGFSQKECLTSNPCLVQPCTIILIYLVSCRAYKTNRVILQKPDTSW